MLNIVLFGGNGYIGRNFTNEWRKKGPAAHFFVLSRSGVNKLIGDDITNIKVDVTDEEAVWTKLPAKVDYIIDFIGAPNDDPQTFEQLNQQPAKVMKDIAEKKQVRAMGFIGGTLGPKKFTQTKKQLIDYLQGSRIPLAYVEPTLVYGAGRKDKMTRNVPFLKFLGIFAPKLRPVLVGKVVADLRKKMLQTDAAN